MAGQTVIVSVLADTRRFSTAMKGVGNEFSKFGQSFGGVGKLVAGAGKAAVGTVVGLGAALTGLAIKGGFERALNIEQATAKLAGLGHDTKSVTAIMDNALASVKGTAFGMGDAANIAASAVASGIAPGQQLERTLKLTADSAAIAGIGLGEMGQVLNKVWAKGRVDMDSINQLTERGIPIMSMLADHYQVSAGEMAKMVSKGRVDADTFRDVLENKVGGAALKMGDTTKGAFDNMLAVLSRLGAAVITPILEPLKQLLGDLTGHFDTLQPTLEEFGAALAGSIQGFGEWLQNTGIPAIQQFFGFLTEHQEILTTIGVGIGIMVGAFYVAQTALNVWNAAVTLAKAVQTAWNLSILSNPLAWLVIAIMAVVGALVYFLTQTETGRKAWATFTSFLKSAWDAVVSWFNTTLANVRKWFADAGTNVQRSWEAVQAFFAGLPARIMAFFASAASWLVSRGREILAGLKRGAETGWATVTSFLSSIPGRITGALAGAGSWLLGIGGQIITGLYNGIRNKIDWVIGMIRGLGSSIINAAKAIFKIASPSRVFADIGDNIVAGLEQGLSDTLGVKKAISKLSDAATSAFDPDLTLNPRPAHATAGGTFYSFDGLTITATSDEARILAEFVAMARRKARAARG